MFKTKIIRANCFTTIFILATIGLGRVSNADDPLPKGHFRLTGASVNPIDRIKMPDGKVQDAKSNLLTHSVRFDVKTTSERVKDTEKKHFKITNPIASMKLTFDKPIKFKDEEIPAGTNILDHKKFNGRTFNVSMRALNPMAMGSVRMTEDFKIPTDDYQVTFEWTCKDGTTISETVEVRIDIGGERVID